MSVLSPPLNLANYIGIPFKENGRDFVGCDCYGLVYMIYLFEFGIALPKLDQNYENVSDHATIRNLVMVNMDDWIEVNDQRLGDVILFKSSYLSGIGYHIGMGLEKNWMIHAARNAMSAIEKFTSSKWSTKVEGFYRHKLMT